jgi:regulator of protease activity HflC (stomatin/prohibitin superfamily)
MFTIKYYKADASTFVIKTVNGKVKRKGRGISFFFNPMTTDIAALPINVQEAPFIFGLQTSDYQSVRVQGQVSYRIDDAEKTADMMNFSLNRDGVSFKSEDPMRISDRVMRSIQTTVQSALQASTLREALTSVQSLVQVLKKSVAEDMSIREMGMSVLDVSISAITPTPETSKALEAVAREEILKRSDDAIYGRRKSSVEQERTIKEAELETEMSVQQKQQEMEEQRVANERALLSGQALIDQERLQAQIDRETQRKSLVEQSAENNRIEADSEGYAITARIEAFKALPVENLKAMAMANMQPEQLMAMAFESLAQNAGKIGELTITPDLFGQLMKRGNGS